MPPEFFVSKTNTTCSDVGAGDFAIGVICSLIGSVIISIGGTMACTAARTGLPSLRLLALTLALALALALLALALALDLALTLALALLALALDLALASPSMVPGMVGQRYAHLRIAAKSPGKLYVLDPIWIVMVIIFIIGNFGDAIALGFAPQSVITPLGSVSLVSNAILAACVLKEALTLPTIVGGGLVIGGVVCIVLPSAFNLPCTQETVDSLCARWEQPGFIIWAALQVTVIVCLVLAIELYFERKMKVPPSESQAGAQAAGEGQAAAGGAGEATIQSMSALEDYSIELAGPSASASWSGSASRSGTGMPIAIADSGSESEGPAPSRQSGIIVPVDAPQTLADEYLVSVRSVQVRSPPPSPPEADDAAAGEVAGEVAGEKGEPPPMPPSVIEVEVEVEVEREGESEGEVKGEGEKSEGEGEGEVKGEGEGEKSEGEGEGEGEGEEAQRGRCARLCRPCGKGKKSPPKPGPDVTRLSNKQRQMLRIFYVMASGFVASWTVLFIKSGGELLKAAGRQANNTDLNTSCVCGKEVAPPSLSNNNTNVETPVSARAPHSYFSTCTA